MCNIPQSRLNESADKIIFWILSVSVNAKMYLQNLATVSYGISTIEFVTSLKTIVIIDLFRKVNYLNFSCRF